MKDYKTTILGCVSAFFGFVLFQPEYFPPVLVDVAAYIFAGGLAALGVSSVDYRRKRKDRLNG